MSRHNPEVFTFLRGVDRAKALCGIYHHCDGSFPAALDCTDILRSAVVLGISSLDHLVHAIVKREIIYRYENRISVRRLVIPFDLFISQSGEIITLLDNHFLESHGYKSFVAPDKISEILSCFIDSPWNSISLEMQQAEPAIKGRLKQIVSWRNRIAHEQDINPQFGGLELWPIDEHDVSSALDFLSDLGSAIAAVLGRS